MDVVVGGFGEVDRTEGAMDEACHDVVDGNVLVGKGREYWERFFLVVDNIDECGEKKGKIPFFEAFG